MIFEVILYVASFLENPINFYSVIHFIEYGILAFFQRVAYKHVLIISIAWELVELFIPYDWAKESVLNKIVDIMFNFCGFYCIRTFL